MRVAAILACVLAATVATACQGGGSGGGSSATAAATPAQTPMRFRRMQSMASQAAALASRGDAASLRAMSARLSNEGLSLIKATMPHDVARTDVPRYIEGRARFGDALKRWVTAVEQGTDADVIQAAYGVDAATRGWIDAYLGREPETSV